MKRKWLCGMLALPLLMGCVPASAAPGAGDGSVQQTSVRQIQQTGQTQQIRQTEALCDALWRLTAGAAQTGEGNLTLSPLSLASVLGMLANGAQGDTRTQLCALLGLSAEECNAALAAWRETAPLGEGCRMDAANAVWVRDTDGCFQPSPVFLRLCRDLYGADLETAPFDARTAEEINRWVRVHTGGRITSVLDSIPSQSRMYLVNAVAFDAKWMKPYEDAQVTSGIFHAANGEGQTVEMLSSVEGTFLADQDCTGFIRPYAGGRYAFVALLPKEGMTARGLAAAMTGERWRALWNAREEAHVTVSMPAFDAAGETDFAAILPQLGVCDLFDPDRADLSAIGTSSQPLFCSELKQKVCLRCDRTGTQGAAVSWGAIAMKTALPPVMRTVTLDRPFLYAVVDCDGGLPLFTGVLEQL